MARGFGLTPFDPAPYLMVALSLAIVACVAGVVPARRALAVDPLLALRQA